MSCSGYDWKAFALGEMEANDRRQAEAHASSCATCREELATTRLTLDAMSVMRDEEAPRRIAFVSDKVFEPRWWQRLMTPGFAGACMVTAAILVHAFTWTPAVDDRALDARIQSAVTKAVAADEQQHLNAFRQMMADYEIAQKQQLVRYVSEERLVRQ